MEDYFVAGPVSTDGAYSDRRGRFDGFIGTLDGIASAVNSVGYTVEEVADIRESWARGQAAADDVRLDRQEREQSLLLDAVKVERGDNIQLYYAVAVAAAAAVFFLR